MEACGPTGMVLDWEAAKSISVWCEVSVVHSFLGVQTLSRWNRRACGVQVSVSCVLQVERVCMFRKRLVVSQILRFAYLMYRSG